MNILVTGANGQLGREIRIASKHSTDHYFFSDIVDAEGLETIQLDITDIAQVRDLIHERQIDITINCAAYTNVDKAEDEPAICELLNSTAPENLAVVMKEVNGLLVHISTDYVFGGEPYNTPCNEEQTCSPTGIYGHTKLLGETAVIKSGCRHIIIRTAWLYSEFGKNFVKTMLDLTATKPELNVVFDQTGSPTYALDLAEVIVEIIEQRKYIGKDGIYNYSNEGVCSWYDFSRIIAEQAGHNECRILPCHSNEFPSKVKRPSYSVLDKTKIKNTFSCKVPYWTDSLKKCIENIKKS